MLLPRRLGLVRVCCQLSALQPLLLLFVSLLQLLRLLPMLLLYLLHSGLIGALFLYPLVLLLRKRRPMAV